MRPERHSRPRIPFFRPFDAWIVAGVAASAVWAMLPEKYGNIRGSQGPGSARYATAFVDGTKAARFDLRASIRDFTLQAPCGEVHVRAGGGAVHIVEAHCPNHLCIRRGEISRAGQEIVCVPCRVLVTVEGDGSETDRGPDAVTF